jgi:hypothetical protein
LLSPGIWSSSVNLYLDKPSSLHGPSAQPLPALSTHRSDGTPVPPVICRTKTGVKSFACDRNQMKFGLSSDERHLAARRW